MNNLLERYRLCYMIRKFETVLESAFANGEIRGTTHGCIGQEIVPVMVMEHLHREDDYVTGTHRCHGQVLAYTQNPYALFCEMMGKKDGFVGGIGGSQHIKIDRYLTNGITGGMVVIGTGMAMAMKKTNCPGIVISFLGDGGFNEGYVQESLNLAATFSLPIVFVCENNKYAMSTPTKKYCSGTFQKRVMALDMDYYAAPTSELDALSDAIDKAISTTRTLRHPSFIEVSTARLCGHSKSDKMEYMSAEEREQDRLNDPLAKMKKLLDADDVNQIETQIDQWISDEYQKAKTSVC